MDIVIYFGVAVHFSDGDIGPHKIFQSGAGGRLRAAAKSRLF